MQNLPARQQDAKEGAVGGRDFEKQGCVQSAENCQLGVTNGAVLPAGQENHYSTSRGLSTRLQTCRPL